MDSTSGDYSTDQFSVGGSTSGLICDKVQQPSTSFCGSVSGRQSNRSGRVIPRLERDVRVRVPSNGSNSGGSTENSNINRQDHTHSTGVAGQGLVSGASGVVGGRSLVPPRVDQVAASTSVQCVQQQHPEATTSRLATIRDRLVKAGFSESVARKISKRNRFSTNKIYQSRWSAFVKWCRDKQLEPIKASIPVIADFLLSLFERGLEVRTISNYKSVIAVTLAHSGRKISDNKDLSDLIRSLSLERPVIKRDIPAWNLALVLAALTKSPFEPAGQASFKFLTFKTVFLLALATGSRISELHAIDNKSIRFSEGYKEVSFAPCISFLAKNQDPQDLQRALRRVTVKALSPTLDDSLREDKSLCPVRALRFYLSETESKRKDCKRLFISIVPPHKDVAKNTLSAWIKKTVGLAYELCDSDTRVLGQVRAHDVRGFAASWAFNNCVSIVDVLRAGTWKNHTTFTSFYLKDVTTIQDGLRSLGTLSVAQQIV